MTKRIFVVDESPHLNVFDLFVFLKRLGMTDGITKYSAGEYFHRYKPEEHTFMQFL